MLIAPIRSDLDLSAAMARIDLLWGSPQGSPEGDELDVLLVLVEAFEAQHHAIPPGDPLEVIRFKLSELGLTQGDLARKLGWGSGRVSEVLNGKREMTMRMVKDLSRVLEIPAGLLAGDSTGAPVGQACGVDLSPELLAEMQDLATQRGLTIQDWLARMVAHEKARPAQVSLVTSTTHSAAADASVHTLRRAA